MDEYASYFPNIDPLSESKRWLPKNDKNTAEGSHLTYDLYSESVKGAFVVSDPVDWGRDIQVSVSCMIIILNAFSLYGYHEVFVGIH